MLVAATAPGKAAIAIAGAHPVVRVRPFAFKLAFFSQVEQPSRLCSEI
jgi:hypothetical protein